MINQKPFIIPLRFRMLALPPLEEEVGFERRERLHEMLLLVVLLQTQPLHLTTADFP
mgnify:CR=1 FL=1